MKNKLYLFYNSKKILWLEHKYSPTLLVGVLNKCKEICPHCFRKKIFKINSFSRGSFQSTKEIKHKIINYITIHPEINNILLTGGDPLLLPLRQLEKMLDFFCTIKQINYLRIGSRLPVFDPECILKNGSLARMLKKYNRIKKIYLATQINHPKEISHGFKRLVRSMYNMGIPIYNQMVLLKGINNNSECIFEIFKNLISIGVLPYYIFQCRPIAGIREKFQESLYRGFFIIEKAKAKLGGMSKNFRYVLSHDTGKIEIVGLEDKRMYFRYLHVRRNLKITNLFFSKKINYKQGWINLN